MSKASVELLRGPVDEEEPKKIYGVVTATVGPLPDPLLQGRVQVTMHFVDCLDMSAFARVATMSTGPGCGSYFVPQPGDEVLIAFEHGDVNSPFIIGSLWNLKSPPPLPTQYMMIKTIRTLTGNQIVFTDGPPSVSIQCASAPPPIAPATPTGIANIIMTPAGVQIIYGIPGTPPAATVAISPAGIEMQTGPTTLSMTPLGIEMKAPDVSIIATGNVSIIATGIRLN